MWLNEMVTRCCDMHDYDHAELYLDEMTRIMQSLRSVIDTGDLPGS